MAESDFTIRLTYGQAETLARLLDRTVTEDYDEQRLIGSITEAFWLHEAKIHERDEEVIMGDDNDEDRPKNPLKQTLPKVPPASPKDPDAAPPIPGEGG